MQRIAPITNGQITGPDPATGNPLTLNGNINALFLLNAGVRSRLRSKENQTKE
jgi:hypothetical protein